jgi:predicted Rossmann fold nucleotide-binding protein DprA/Smf involved in DNA uptake
LVNKTGCQTGGKSARYYREIPQYVRENMQQEVSISVSTAIKNSQTTSLPPPLETNKPKTPENKQNIINLHIPTENSLERKILSILNPEGSYVDEVALSCQIPVSEALSTLTLMEIKGLVKQFSGKRFAKI